MELTSIQAAMIAEAAAKDMAKQAKAFRAVADEDIMDLYRQNGAKTFDVALETEDRRVSIGTASVAVKGGRYEIADFESFADSAADAGELETTVTIPNDLYDEVYAALRDAGLTEKLRFREVAAEDWEDRTVEVRGRLVWSKTGEPVEGVEWVNGKTYTVLKPKSVDIIRKTAMALYGMTPAAMLEGGTDAE